MKLKKIISLGLATVLSLSMFAGCGEKNPNTEQQGDGNQVSPTVTQSPDDGDNEGNGSDVDEEVRFVENIYDMGGKTIKIHDNWHWNFLNYDPSGWSRWETKAGAVIEQIEKDYNVNIEILSDIDHLVDNMATSMAAGQVYANIIVSMYQGPDSPKAHYAADVTKIKNLGLDTNDWADCGEMAMAAGRQIAVGCYLEEFSPLNPLVMVFNKDIAEQYEIEDIYELVRNNEWTYEKFEEICTEITTKSNGAVKGLLAPDKEFVNFPVTNNADYIIEKDGKYVYNGLSDEIVTAYEFAQNLIRNGLFDIDTFSEPDKDNVGDRTNAFGREHKTLFFMCHYDWLVSDIDYRLENYGIVPLPRGPHADTYTTSCDSKLYYFTKDDPDIEDAAAVLVAIANRLSLSEEEYYQYQYDRGFIRDDESYENMLLIAENLALNGDVWAFYPELAQKVAYNLDYTPRQALEQSAQQAQARIDEFLNKE